MVTKKRKRNKKVKFVKYKGKLKRVTISQYNKIQSIKIRNKRKINSLVKKILEGALK